MKKIPLLITIPLIAVMSIVAIALGIKFFAPKPEVAVLKPTEFPNVVSSTETTKPSTFLGALFGKKAVVATPTPTPATAVDLSTELKGTYDDGGQAELDAMKKDTAAL